MNKDAKKIARRIDEAFAALREHGFFAKANHTCCMSCGLAQIPEDKEMAYVFYHMQDLENLKDAGLCYLAWGGNDGEKLGHTICDTIRAVGLEVEWNGSESDRIAVSGLACS